MKYLQVLLAFSLMLLFSCESDFFTEQPDENVAFRTSEDMPMLPFHGEFMQEIDFTGGFLACIPAEAGLPPFPRLFTVEGKATHLGKLQGGSLEILNCTLDPATGALGGDIVGTMIAANGDLLNFYGYATAFPDGSGSAECTIDGGTGRWENACGSYTTQSAGQVGEPTMIVIADGEICAPGQTN